MVMKGIRTTGEILEKYIRRKMSQVELSQLMDVSPQYISNIINDLKGPSEKFIRKFYNIFDVDEEDKKGISDYEEFRRLPKNIQEELLLFRGSIVKEEDTPILETDKVILQGEIIGNGKIFPYEKPMYKYFPKISDEKGENLFSLLIRCGDYFPDFHEEDLLILEKWEKLDFQILDGVRCLIEYEGRKIIAYVRYINETIVIRSLEQGEETLLFTRDKYFNLKIHGIVKGCFRKF